MKKIKRILALVLCICFAFHAMFVTAAEKRDADGFDAYAFSAYVNKAREAFTDALAHKSADDVQAQAASVKFRYVTQGTEAMISGVENCPGVLYIPETIDGYTVVSIGDEAFKYKDIYELYLPKAVRYIGISAFANCKNLYMAVLPDGLKQIDHNAFFNCTALSYVGTAVYSPYGSIADVSVYMPSALEYLGVGVFCDCKALVGMIFRQNLKELPEYTFSGCGNMEMLVSYADSLGKGAFRDASIDGYMQLNVLNKVSRAAFQNAKVGFVLYSGSEPRFLKAAKGLTVYGGVYAIGADVYYKATGRFSDVIDRDIIDEIRQNSTVNAFICDDSGVVRVGSDGNTYEAVSVGQTLLRHPYYDLLNEYEDPDDGDGFPPTPAYVTVSYAWWQQFIRIFLLGFIWY